MNEALANSPPTRRISGRFAQFFCMFLSVVCLVYRGEAQENIDRVPREWIENDIHFIPTSDRRFRLALRREEVRAALLSEVPSAEADMKTAIGMFSDASELPLVYTHQRPNIVAVVTSPINDGDKPNIALLRKMRLPDKLIDQIMRTGRWPSGCGFFFFHDASGSIELSLIFADKRLAPGDLKDCVTDGVMRAFGLRIERETVARVADGYLYYLLLAKVLRYCDHKPVVDPAEQLNVGDLKQRYADCALQLLGKVNTK